MSRFDEKILKCPKCSASQSAQIPTSINASIRNAFKDEIMRGDFQRFTCTSCAHVFYSEDPFMYMDFDEKLWIAHFPSDWERNWNDLENEPREQFEKYMTGAYASPHAKALAGGFTLRTVFGLRQLAEKLLVLQSGIDDRLLVALKWQLMNAEGGILHPDLRPVLTAVSKDELFFTLRNGESLSINRGDAFADILADPGAWASLLDPLKDAMYVDPGRFLMGGD